MDEKSCECPICLQLTVVPIMVECGHIYCTKCVEECTNHPACPICRKSLDGDTFVPVKIVEKTIEKYVTLNEGLCSLTKTQRSTMRAERESSKNGNSSEG